MVHRDVTQLTGTTDGIPDETPTVPGTVSRSAASRNGAPVVDDVTDRR
ncbi:hypothetical protein ACIQXD_32610 [Streptomyces uncialis]